jgi:hypothetical protein
VLYVGTAVDALKSYKSPGIYMIPGRSEENVLRTNLLTLSEIRMTVFNTARRPLFYPCVR